jgi:DNA-binding HxlR family transcriptional regulator
MAHFYTRLYSVSINDLVSIFHHRWAAPVLAELERSRGSRFVFLARSLELANESLRRTLDALMELGLVRRNPGYGHPLRPEYLLTPRGREAARVCGRILAAAEDVPALRKWAVPILAALDGGRRFSELRVQLPGVTARSLALALKDLQQADLVDRQVVEGYPPTTLYQPTAAGRRVQRALR